MSKIHSAASGGVDDAVSKLLDKGQDVNARKKLNGKTPLHLAVENSHASTVTLLLGRGADADSRANSGETPLHGAGDAETVRALLAAGADAGARAKNSLAPLHTQAKEGRIECIEALLEAGVDIDVPGERGRTALHEAAMLGHVDAVRFLLDRGADASARDAKGYTPLDVAKATGALGGKAQALAAELLSSAGATRHEVGRLQTLREMRARERVAKDLIDAVTDDDVEKVEDLLDKGYSVDMDDGDFTALHHAVTRGHASPQRLDIVRALIRERADVDRRTKRGLTQHESDKRWQTGVTLDALAYSLFHGGMGFEGIGFTPLDLTAMLDDWEAAALLIQAGADVNAAGHEGETALHLTVMYGADKTAHILVDAGADVNAKTQRQETPLAWASRRLASRGLRGEYKAKVEAIARLLREHSAAE